MKGGNSIFPGDDMSGSIKAVGSQHIPQARLLSLHLALVLCRKGYCGGFGLNDDAYPPQDSRVMRLDRKQPKDEDQSQMKAVKPV